jgi:hypothetical protein
MKLTGKLKTRSDYAAMKEEQREVDKKASMHLTDDELVQVSGGGGFTFRCPFCGTLNTSGVCECGWRSVLK